ncbi:MAG: class I SAM-dependent methyltransferase [Chrysiogenia bacterium]
MKAIKKKFIINSLRLRTRIVHNLLDCIPEKKRILDIGCGTGDIISSIALKYCASVVGIDNAKKMIDICRRTQEKPNLTFEVGNIFELPFADHTFDVVLSISLIEWIDDYEKAIDEVARVVKHGGIWIVSIPNWQSPFRKLQKILSRFQNNSYLHFQKNKLTNNELEVLATSKGFIINETIFHILPFFPIIIKNQILKHWGMMCMLSFSMKNEDIK